MSLHELKEEKERQDRLADEFWAEVSLAQEEIQAAQMRMNAAKVKHSEAVCMMTILSDKIAEMEDARGRAEAHRSPTARKRQALVGINRFTRRRISA